ncbi:hypothetical protein [Halomonas tibetensis]|uniref:Glycosyltransferase RgtA/B/C/D-like domain-containing protein n=1 Tax=Halomonas tibetensis TaxID=2259590 RepID=A0ABV7BBI4_9GAMM
MRYTNSSNVKINKKILLVLLLTPLFFVSSMFLVSNYIYGDQISYQAFYKVLSTASYRDVMSVARDYLSSGEPVSAYFLWVGAKLGIDKNIYISFLNTAMLIFLTIFLLRYKVKGFVIALLLTNVYVIVLMTGAERLKISYIFLFLAALSHSNRRMFFVGLSPLAHFQSLIILPSLAIYSFHNYFSRFVSNLKVDKKILYGVFLVFLASFIFVAFFIDPLLSKASAYMRGDVRFLSLFQISLLFASILPLALNKIKWMLIFLYFSSTVLLLGGERINMIAFTAVAYILVTEGKLSVLRFHNIPFVLILVYLSFKSVSFVGNVLEHGTGFYSG